MVITLYVKAGCHLCDEARELLEELAAVRAFELREIDILGDTALFERYRYRIPVVTVDGQEMLEGRLGSADLAAALGLAS